MRDANTIGADKYFHCKANCQAAKLLGIEGYIDSMIVSEVRELVDEYLKGDPNIACDEDRYANQVGRNGGLFSNTSCTEVCSQFRPNGLDPKY